MPSFYALYFLLRLASPEIVLERKHVFFHAYTIDAARFEMPATSFSAMLITMLSYFLFHDTRHHYAALPEPMMSKGKDLFSFCASSVAPFRKMIHTEIHAA